MSRILVVATALFVTVAGGVLATAQQQRDPEGRTVWDGVFTEEQAARGATVFAETCTSCHGANLEGSNRAKALVGDTFWRDFAGRQLSYVLDFMSENMPNNAQRGTLSSSTYLDLTAFVLSRNNFPAGTESLTAEATADILIIPESGELPELADKALARVVGCLAKGDSGWVVNNAAAPVRADEESDDVARPLGDRSISLLFVITRLDRMVGHRVVVRGILDGDGGVNGINVTEINSLNAMCE